MKTDFNNILIFRTNIRTESDVHFVRSTLASNEQILDHSIDIDDVDCVLRIVSESMGVKDIINLINVHGYECYELES